MSRLIVFEGVFDPPHIGHFWAAQSAIEDIKGQLLICPAPLEAACDISGKSNVSGYYLRVQMCELGFPNALVYKHENKYTIDLVKELQNKFGYLDLTIIHGPDWDILKYHNWAELEKKANFRRIENSDIQIRSTLIRKRISEGKPITGMVLPEVEMFIRGNEFHV